MPRVQVLDGRGLDAAVRATLRQAVLWYRSQAERNADLLQPWEGATTLFPGSDGVLRLEGFYNGSWRTLGGSGGGGGIPGVTDHGDLTGLADDDHPQYLTSAEGNALFLTQAAADARYVNVTGDEEMTGNLGIGGRLIVDGVAVASQVHGLQVQGILQCDSQVTLATAPTIPTHAVPKSYVDTNFAPVATGMPGGGSVTQVLTKNSTGNYDAAWKTPISYLVVKTTEPTAADYGLASIPTGAVWIDT